MPALLEGENMYITTKTNAKLDEDELKALNILRDTYNQCTCIDELDCSECPFKLSENETCIPMQAKRVLEWRKV